MNLGRTSPSLGTPPNITCRPPDRLLRRTWNLKPQETTDEQILKIGNLKIGNSPKNYLPPPRLAVVLHQAGQNCATSMGPKKEPINEQISFTRYYRFLLLYSSFRLNCRVTKHFMGGLNPPNPICFFGVFLIILCGS